MSTVRATNFQHASATNPAIVLAADGSATANVSAINGGPLAGMRNAIINGNFDIWQRGTSFTNPNSGNGYLADRWVPAWNGTGATRTITREAFTPGQTDVPNEPTYYLRWNQTVSGSGGTFNDLLQRIEGVRSFAGQTVIFSFYAKAAATTTLPNVNYIQGFGTGGSPSPSVGAIMATNIALTTSWQKFAYSFAVPSIASKVLGSDGNDSLTIAIRMPLNATFTIDIAQVQVEAGPVATPFERRPIGTELALCQRYYHKSYGTEVVPGTVNSAGIRFASPAAGTGSTGGSAVFPVTMRATPTIVFYSTTTGNSGVVRSKGADRTATSPDGVSTSMLNLASGGGFSGDETIFHYTASAEL